MEGVEFHKQVKDALEHLYDTAYLEAHPLLAQITDPSPGGHLTRAQNLRSLLKEAVETLRPPANVPASAPEWRCYLAVQHHYVAGMSINEIEGELGISTRQVQRELHKGLGGPYACFGRSAVHGPPNPAPPALPDRCPKWRRSSLTGR